ncbi:MAG: nitroreductase family protein, partial [Candidatus Obscuribacterales bacterium]|nr:nitroreductase family protein [Candidatus Obscuribacterales bacterium]
MSKLHTSPLLFLRPGGQSTIEGRPLQTELSLKDIEMLSFFAEPASPERAIEEGFEKDYIERALDQGLLVAFEENGFCRGGSWEAYNLQRAAFLMFECLAAPRNGEVPKFKTHLNANKQNIAEAFPSFLKRRTERFFTNEPIALDILEKIGAELCAAIAENSWLSFRVLVQSVDGVEPGVYKFENETGKFRSCVEHFTRKDLLECLHGQWWLNGGGVCWFFVVNFAELAKKADCNPKNYSEMIMLLGEAGQALVNSVYANGLGTWMTPAVS